MQGESAEDACTPDSVPPEGGGRHLSGAGLTVDLDATLLVPPGRREFAEANSIRAVLLQVGFTLARVTAERRALLPHDFTLTVSCEAAVCFCGTFLRVAPTGRYPAPCPMEPGRSSTHVRRDGPASSAATMIAQAAGLDKRMALASARPAMA